MQDSFFKEVRAFFPTFKSISLFLPLFQPKPMGFGKYGSRTKMILIFQRLSPPFCTNNHHKTKRTILTIEIGSSQRIRFTRRGPQAQWSNFMAILSLGSLTTSPMMVASSIPLSFSLLTIFSAFSSGTAMRSPPDV